MKKRKGGLLKEFEKLDQKLSNPKELIYSTCKLASNLAPVWESGYYYQKQIFQNTLFPNGLAYDSKIEHYRTPVVNEAIGYLADLSRVLGQTEKRTSPFLEEKSDLVLGTGLEPVRLLRSQDFKSCVSTNSTTQAKAMVISTKKAF